MERMMTARRRSWILWILYSLLIAIAVLALGNGVILRAIDRALEPAPSRIIIVAPVDSEKV
jgi:hypothetical protein